ncbi:methionine synthase [Aeromicrobium marinum]|nr:methionine synthase [Aeromicrobium marinum]
MTGTGIGSMPGEDLAETLRIVLDTVGDLPFVPELPARGAPAGMIGRSGAMLDGLGLDLQPAGWRFTPAPGLDHRRARSLLARDLDLVEELAHGHVGRFKQQVAGPWTLAAMIERPLGDKVLADHGARRELAESLAEGLGGQIADLRRRLPDAQIVVQVDEPALPAVLGAGVPTASGFSRHRAVHPPEVDAALRMVTEAIRRAGATPVVHVCAAEVPVALLAGAGFAAISFDQGLARPTDVWAEIFESGVDLWPGVVPSTDADLSDRVLRGRVDAFFDRMGFGEDSRQGRVVVTPTCGLAGASPAHAAAALTTAARLTT